MLPYSGYLRPVPRTCGAAASPSSVMCNVRPEKEKLALTVEI